MSTIATTFCPGSTITSVLKFGQAVVVDFVSGEKESVVDGAALLLVSCCFFTKKRVTGIAKRIRNKLPRMKYLFVNNFMVAFLA